MSRRRSPSPYVTRRIIELRADIRRRERNAKLGLAVMIFATFIVLAIGVARGSLI